MPLMSLPPPKLSHHASITKIRIRNYKVWRGLLHNEFIASSMKINQLVQKLLGEDTKMHADITGFRLQRG
jgi:hypothetical protein